MQEFKDNGDSPLVFEYLKLASKSMEGLSQEEIKKHQLKLKEMNVKLKELIKNNHVEDL
jgi:hypothetical protein